MNFENFGEIALELLLDFIQVIIAGIGLSFMLAAAIVILVLAYDAIYDFQPVIFLYMAIAAIMGYIGLRIWLWYRRDGFLILLLRCIGLDEASAREFIRKFR